MILVTTTDSVPGYRILDTKGLVRGTAIRTRHVFHDFAEWLRNLVGSELHHYTKMIAETREQALDRLKDHARQMGGNAVVGVRFTMSRMAAGSAEMLAYGTAVVLEREAPPSGGVDTDLDAS